MRMDLSRYNAEDIHEMRVLMAEKYRNMTEEEAARDFERRVESSRASIEEFRRAKAIKNA
jgi:hypothetical protein